MDNGGWLRFVGETGPPARLGFVVWWALLRAEGREAAADDATAPGGSPVAEAAVIVEFRSRGGPAESPRYSPTELSVEEIKQGLRMRTIKPPSGAEALRALRDAFPDSSLTLRVAALNATMPVRRT